MSKSKIMSILKDIQTRNSIPFLEEPAPSEEEMIEAVSYTHLTLPTKA